MPESDKTFCLNAEQAAAPLYARAKVMSYCDTERISHISMRKSSVRKEDEILDLVMDYERTFDMAKIKEAAEAAGMKKPTAGQVEYVELGGGSKAEVYQAESDSLLSQLTHSVKSGIGALVEYFR